MEIINDVLREIDPLFISFFRLTGVALPDFFIGVFLLAMGCTVLGELTLSLALRFNRDYLNRLEREVVDRERMSVQAYHLSDRPGYSALNQAAHDAWGKHFFTMAAYSGGMLWPVPFALAWMDTRFHAVPFALPAPLSWVFGDSTGYPFIFILIYILSRILFKNLRPYLPYFRGVQRMLDRKGEGKVIPC